VTRTRKIVFVAVLVLIGLPAGGLAGVVAFLHLMNPVVMGASNQASGTIVSSGRTREYLLHVPKGYDPARSTPLVVSLHGAALWPSVQRDISRWSDLADREGFIVVYPSGTPLKPLPLPLLPSLPVWLQRPESGRNAEIRFISELIDALQNAYNVDPARIYVNGFSNGGGMAFVLSCTLSHRIAAVGTVAAAQELPWSWCADSRAVPMITFHGTSDRFVPYDVAPGSAAHWAQRNRCGPRPGEDHIAADVTRLRYEGCAQGASVMLYTIQGGGHSWPGGKPMPAWFVGATTPNVDATREMWAFFREHTLARN
jgi:polyhydroxybutyrate depolymerase